MGVEEFWKRGGRVEMVGAAVERAMGGAVIGSKVAIFWEGGGVGGEAGSTVVVIDRRWGWGTKQVKLYR